MALHKSQWVALLILLFGALLVPRVVTFAAVYISGADCDLFLNGPVPKESLRSFVLALAVVHFTYVLMALISATGIFLRRSWAPSFWFLACILILSGTLAETFYFDWSLTDYWFELTFTTISVFSYGTDFAREAKE